MWEAEKTFLSLAAQSNLVVKGLYTNSVYDRYSGHSKHENLVNLATAHYSQNFHGHLN